MSIITVGIDLAKNVFAVHGVDDNGKPSLVTNDGKLWIVTEYIPSNRLHKILRRTANGITISGLINFSGAEKATKSVVKQTALRLGPGAETTPLSNSRPAFPAGAVAVLSWPSAGLG